MFPRTADQDETRRVGVVLDIACVWSYLGFARLRGAAARHREAGRPVEIVFYPFQVAPDASTEGVPLTEIHRRDFGEQAEAKVEYVRALTAAEGLSLRVDRAVFANTFHAHRLVAQAAGYGMAETMVERLFRAYFVDGRNVSDTAVLRELAEEAGVDFHDGGVDRTRAELRRVRRAVSTVPTFVFGGGAVLADAPSERAVLAALDTATSARPDLPARGRPVRAG